MAQAVPYVRSMRAVLRLLLLVAAAVLAITPATAHGTDAFGRDGSHCAPAVALAMAAHHHHAPADADGHVAAAAGHHGAAGCLCALVTTLPPMLRVDPPGFVRSPPPRPDVKPLLGLAAPPSTPPPRAEV